MYFKVASTKLTQMQQLCNSILVIHTHVVTWVSHYCAALYSAAACTKYSFLHVSDGTCLAGEREDANECGC